MTQYHFPPVDLLSEAKDTSRFSDRAYVSGLGESLNQMFTAFKLDVTVIDSNGYGYCILFKLKLGEGVSADTVRKLRTEIEVTLDGNSVEFMELPEGDRLIIAIKNQARPKIMLKDVIRSTAFQEAESKLTVAAGMNVFAGYVTFDIEKYVNLIIVGMTGAGKTTFLNDIILSVLYKARPDEVQIALIDTKGADLPLLNGIPHTREIEVAATTISGVKVIKWLQNEMTERLALMKAKKAENLDEYNKYSKEKKPRWLLIIDEYAELKRGTKEDLDQMLIDMAKYSKQTGIHLIVATQGARTEFLSTALKKAIPARACLAVVDKRESKIVIAKTGADRLAGDGDMIITENDEDQGLFLQAAYASDEDIDRVAEFLRNEELY